MNTKKHIQISPTKLCRQNIMCQESHCKELDNRKMRKLKENKLRQLLWETTPELKELRRMMLTADVTREQAMQMAEKKVLRQLEREEEEADSQTEAIARESMQLEEQQQAKAKKEYHKELDQLCQFKKMQESYKLNQLEKEKEIIDEIAKQIIEEDRKQVQDKLEKRRELRRQMEELHKVREGIKLREKQKENAEDWKVDEYRKAQELRAQEREEKRHLDLEQRLQVQEELLNHLEKAILEKQQREQLRTNLSIKEKEAAERSRSLKKEHEKRRIQDDLQKAYEMQLYVKMRKEELQKKEEQLFRQNLMAKLYEEEQLDMMSQQKRRQKQIEHKLAVEAALQDRRQRKIEEAAREASEFRKRTLEEAEHNRMVNEERIRFLNEHARDLLGYLPKGIFKDKETVEKLGEEFQTFYFHRN